MLWILRKLLKEVCLWRAGSECCRWWSSQRLKQLGVMATVEFLAVRTGGTLVRWDRRSRFTPSRLCLVWQRSCYFLTTCHKRYFQLRVHWYTTGLSKGVLLLQNSGIQKYFVVERIANGGGDPFPFLLALIRFLVLLVAVQTRPVSSRPVIYIVPR